MIKMLVKNLDYLSIPQEFSKVDINVYKSYSIQIIFIENKGYAAILNDMDNINSIYLLKTKLTPKDIIDTKDSEDFIKVIKEFLDKIYKDSKIKEYEKQHHEHVFLKLMDMFSDKENVKLISKDNSSLYEIIEKAFIKLELDIINNKIDSLTAIISDVSNRLDSTISSVEEKDWGNRLRNVLEK